VRARHKAWALPFLAEHPEIVLTDPKTRPDIFALQPLYLEIGAGKGDFVLAMAEHGGEWIALERETSIAGLLAKKVLLSEKKNIVVYPVDFDAGYEELKPYSFAAIYLNFSDPWPKKKHWKRRLTTKERLSHMVSLLAEGGRLYFKSDNEALYEFTKEEAALLEELSLVEDEPDYVFDAIHDAMSEYERNFREESFPIHRLVYEKKKSKMKKE
jgi:tRNA (guanine-N7-)-methyltransferase